MKMWLPFVAALPAVGVLTLTAAHAAYEKAQPPSLKVTVECPTPGDPVPDGAMVGVDGDHIGGSKAEIVVAVGAHHSAVDAGVWHGYTSLQDVGVPAGLAHVEVRPQSGSPLVRNVTVPACPSLGSR